MAWYFVSSKEIFQVSTRHRVQPLDASHYGIVHSRLCLLHDANTMWWHLRKPPPNLADVIVYNSIMSVCVCVYVCFLNHSCADCSVDPLQLALPGYVSIDKKTLNVVCQTGYRHHLAKNGLACGTDGYWKNLPYCVGKYNYLFVF